LVVLLLGLCAVLAPRARAAEPVVLGKFFVSTVVGSVTCVTDGRVLEIKKGDTLDARGAILRTGPGEHVVVVFSNGTAVYLDENTRLDIETFEQEFFAPNNNLGLEPSNSRLLAGLVSGRLFVSTPELRGGTSLVFNTDDASVALQSGQFVIAHSDAGTQVAVISGHATVNTRDSQNRPAAFGQRLAAGEQTWTGTPPSDSTLSPALPATAPPATVTPFDASWLAGISTELAAAQAAQSSVLFSIAATDDTGARLFGIKAQPTVPPVLPLDFVVSPAIGR
jgi:hypothetical protein